MRAHKGMTLERARDIVRDVSYFATMMVHAGHADGMVSGAAHSTAHTITPSFEIIKTAPGTTSVSSVFFMCLADRVLVYGDCAVIPDPTVEELADIAVSSADTAAQFGIEPRVAMLSYSTGESGTGADVDKVRAATELVKARRPDLPVDGPIQYDAAVDAAVGEAKLPGSDVAGRATVFIFPDLNTGNNTYKAVQRSAGAVAIGPVLQGLNKPVNDLSRGATVRDIVNTVAITAIQAQAMKSERGTADTDAAPLSVSATVLVFNSGSSSIKYELVDPHRGARLTSGLIERIGEDVARIEHTYDGDHDRTSRSRSRPTARRCRTVLALFDELGPRLSDADVVAVGHRVVMGGEHFAGAVLIDADVVATIDRLAPLAPLHNPANLAGIDVARELLPDIAHVAVFDTAFFHDLPPAAATYALDRQVAAQHSVRRYGFHGTSHRYVSRKAAEVLGRDVGELRQIVLHLGNGASASAVLHGVTRRHVDGPHAARRPRHGDAHRRHRRRRGRPPLAQRRHEHRRDRRPAQQAVGHEGPHRPQRHAARCTVSSPPATSMRASGSTSTCTG